MARKFYVTKQFVEQKISDEQGTRLTRDNTINQAIQTQATQIAEAHTQASQLAGSIVAENGARLAQAGDMTFDASLKVADTDTGVSTLTEAINSVTKTAISVDTKLDTIDPAKIETLVTNVEALGTKLASLDTAIETILAGSDVDADTFAEVFALITQKTTDTTDALNAMRADLDAAIEGKMNKVQEDTETALIYKDANTDITDTYKLIIVDGQLAIESIPAE
jgi:hypothetical protein